MCVCFQGFKCLCGTEQRDSNGQEETLPQHQCHLSSRSRDHATTRLGWICVWVDVCQRSVEKLTSITAPTPPYTSSVYHNILPIKIHKKIKSKRIKWSSTVFVAVSLCRKYIHVGTYMYLHVCTYMYLQAFRGMEDLSTMDRTHVLSVWCVFPPPLFLASISEY